MHVYKEILEFLEDMTEKLQDLMERIFTVEKEHNCALGQLSHSQQNFDSSNLNEKRLLLKEKFNDLKKMLKDNNIECNGYRKQTEIITNGLPSIRKKYWYPEESYIQTPTINLDVFKEKLEELNSIVDPEEKQLYTTSNGATFKPSEYITVTLYADGLILPCSKFREYSDAEVQHFIGDVMDGFFPEELQHKYPEGVIFQVLDNRAISFLNRNKSKLKFTGGVKLGSCTNTFMENSYGSNMGQDLSNKSTTEFKEILREMPGILEKLQKRFPKDSNEVNVKILSSDGSQAIILSLSQKTEVGYLLKILANNGENARLLMGYPPKPITKWSSEIKKLKKTPTLEESGIQKNSLLRIQIQSIS